MWIRVYSLPKVIASLRVQSGDKGWSGAPPQTRDSDTYPSSGPKSPCGRLSSVTVYLVPAAGPPVCCWAVPLTLIEGACKKSPRQEGEVSGRPLGLAPGLGSRGIRDGSAQGFLRPVQRSLKEVWLRACLKCERPRGPC